MDGCCARAADRFASAALCRHMFDRMGCEINAPPGLRHGSAGSLCSDAEDANNLTFPEATNACCRLDLRLWNLAKPVARAGSSLGLESTIS
jgi:hypothetical protein